MEGKVKGVNISVYDQDYIPYIIKWGRFTNLVGILLSYLPALLLMVIYGYIPPFGAVMAGLVMQASVSGVFWFVEPISYFPVLGVPGTYMSFLSGNIGNLRLPVAVAAQEAAGVQPGTEQGSIISTIGVGVSIVVNIVILTIGVLLGASVLSLMPTNVLATLNNILPAIFGAMFAQQLVAKPKIGVVAAVLASCMIGLSKAGVLGLLPFGGTYAIIIVAVFGSILIGRYLYKDKLKDE